MIFEHDMELVLVESPFAGRTPEITEENIAYARRCLKDCLNRFEAPFASHLLYTQPGVLDDTVPEERTLGIKAGLRWGSQADLTVVYIDHGVSKGMILGIRNALEEYRPIEIRSLVLPADEAHEMTVQFRRRTEELMNEPYPGDLTLEAIDAEAKFLAKVTELVRHLFREPS